MDQIPKLVKDKVKNYYYTERENKKIKDLYKHFRDMLSVIEYRTNTSILLCNHYDLVDGCIEYCKEWDFTELDHWYPPSKNNMHCCHICIDSRKSYCNTHIDNYIKGKNKILLKMKYKDSKITTICEKCVETQLDNPNKKEIPWNETLPLDTSTVSNDDPNMEELPWE
jgi:hypothetical protein